MQKTTEQLKRISSLLKVLNERCQQLEDKIDKANNKKPKSFLQVIIDTIKEAIRTTGDKK